MCVAVVASKGVLYQAKAYLEGFRWWCKGYIVSDSRVIRVSNWTYVRA